MSTHKYEIPVEVVHRIWTLCQYDVEFAGQMVPHINSKGRCVLISNEPYHGQGRRASMPESIVAQTSLGCFNDGHSINVFYHTHPLSVVAQKNFGRYAPPSIHDFFAHCVLSNYRNWKANGQINTAMIMATEGLYIYHIKPTHFTRLVNRIETMFAAQSRLFNAQKDFAFGHLPKDIVDELRDEHYNALTGAFSEYVSVMKQTRSNDNFDLDTGKFFVTMQKDRDFIVNNVYHERLKQCGFFYVFYPAPFKEEVKLQVNI